MNTENLSTAQTKAIEDGGTKNVLIGRSLVKRGIMVEQEDMSRAIIPFRFVLSAEYTNAEEAKFADAMEAEENAADDGSHEAWQIAQWQADANRAEIEALSDEYMLADADRGAEIEARLRELNASVPVLAETVITNPNLTPEQSFAVAVRNDDLDAAREILNGAAPAVRDPRETRYAQIERWTDENLEVKYGILSRRIMRKTLLKADRMQAERQCQIVENELLRRGIKPNRNV